MNKLSENNKDKIGKILLLSINDKNSEIFINKMLDYSTKSNMYSSLIMYIIEKIYLSHNGLRSLIEYHINIFIDNFIEICSCTNSQNNQNDIKFERCDSSNDYDIFCMNVKNKKKKQYTIISIISIYMNETLNKNLNISLCTVFTTILNSLQIVIEKYLESKNNDLIIMIESILQFLHELLKCSQINKDKNCIEQFNFTLSFDKNELNIFPNQLKFKILDMYEVIK